MTADVCSVSGRRGLLAEGPCPLDEYNLQQLLLDDYRCFAATTIQRVYRGFAVRVSLRRQRDAHLAAQLTEQRTALDAAARRQQQQRLDGAACCIQHAWASFNNRRIYRYYRDLIRLREQGDPRALLRCINAQEAELVDAAAGIHVRFRLGGSTFPPLVFYKIFTHRPVADICAFGPRNYAHEAAVGASPAPVNASSWLGCGVGSSGRSSPAPGRQQPSSQPMGDDTEFELGAELRAYTKPDGSIGYRSTSGWYQRVENNGWRPLSERLLQGQSSGVEAAARRRPVFHSNLARRQEKAARQSQDGAGGAAAPRQRLPAFHHSTLVRKQELAARQRQRKRQWLLKMYQLGAQQGAAAPHQGSSEDEGSEGEEGEDEGDAHLTQAAAQLQQHGISARSRSGAGGPCWPSLRPCSTSWEQTVPRQQPDGRLASAAVNAAGEAGEGVDLLRWAEALDYDTYTSGWSGLACTTGSEALVPQSELQLLSKLAQLQA